MKLPKCHTQVKWARPTRLLIVMTLVLSLTMGGLYAQISNGDSQQSEPQKAGDDGDWLPLTAEEQAWLKANPVIKVAPDPDYAPVESYENGAFQGISIDYLEVVGEAYNINFEYILYNSWTEVLEAAKKGDVHMISAAVATEKRSEYLGFTDIYLVMPTRMFIKAGNAPLGRIEDMKGLRIASIRGYSTTEYLSLVAPHVAIVPVDDISDGLTRLSLGEVDGFIGDMGQVGYYLEALNIGNVVLDTSVDFDFPFNLSLAVNKKNTVLLGILQKAVQSFPQERYDAIKRKWLRDEWYSGGIPKELIVTAGIFFTLAVALLIVVIFWNYTLQRRVSHKTRALEEELRRSRIYQEQMRVLIDTIPYPIFVKDNLYNFLIVNRAYAEFFGKDPKDFEGVKDDIIYHQNDNTPMRRYRVLESEVLETNAPKRISDYHLVDKSGTAHVYDMQKVPYPLEDTDKHGILAIAVDITELKKKEQERLDALNRLVSNISNQINTPLGNIVSSLSYLLMNHGEFMDAKERRQLTSTHIDRYAESVGDVCDISIKGINRIQAIMDAFVAIGMIQAKEKSVQVNVYEMLSILLSNRKSSAAFTYSVHVPTNQMVSLPATAFEEVLNKVFDNAIVHAFNNKGLPAGNRENRIDVYWEDLGDFWLLKVSDNGPGIPEELMDKILDPLFSTTHHLGSLGIGLSLTNSLVREVLKGELSIKNRPSGGVEVAISLKKDPGVSL